MKKITSGYCQDLQKLNNDSEKVCNGRLNTQLYFGVWIFLPGVRQNQILIGIIIWGGEG